MKHLGKLCWLAVAFWTVSCASVHLSTTNETAKSAYNEGMQYEKQGEIGWRKAIDAYRKAVREDAGFAEAYRSLGRLYELRGHYQQAAENYKLALSIQPNESGLYLAYGRALFNAGKYQDALKYLQQYNAFFPLDKEGIEWLAETQRLLGDPNAEILYLQLAQIDSQNADALKALANYYYEDRQYAKALLYFRKLTALTKIIDANIFYQFGFCLVQTQQWDEAQKQFENAVALNGQNELFKEYADIVAKISKKLFHADAFEHYLAAVYQIDAAETSKEKLPLYKNAIELLNSALAQEPSFVLAHKELARINYTLGKDDDALKSYEFLIHAGKASKYDYTNAAYLSFRKDNLEKAKTYYEASLLIDPSQADVQHYLQTIEKILNGSIKKESYFFYDKGVKASAADSAEWYLKKAIAVDSSYYEAYLELGNLQMRIGKYRDAETTFSKGLLLSAESDIQATFHYNLGLTYARRDLHDKAIVQFQKTLEFDPGDSDALYNLSKTYLDKSDLPNAIKTYDRLLKDNPDYFQPSLDEIEEFALDQSRGINVSKTVNMASVLKIGQTNTYVLKVKSKNDALFGADANGDMSREMTITFREQVQDISEFGEAEFALDILSVEGYALLPQEKKAVGQRLYLKISDVYGVTNIYGLLEENPYSLPRFVIAVMEDLHGAYLRRLVAEGEMWRSGQYIFKLGTVDAVMVLDELDGSVARGTKYYGVTGSYDAARYGDVGRVYVFNKGSQTFEYDAKKNLMIRLNNQFSTKLFSESTAKMDIQEASYELTLKDIRFEQLEKPKKVVIANIPYVKQHGPQCAAASLSMVLSHYKQSIDQDEIYAAIKSDFAGAQLNDIVNYPRSLGKYKAFGYIGTLEDLKDRIDQGIPVLVFLTPFGGGHVVVVIGYDETKHQIIMHDPTVANDHAVSYDDFLREWKQSGNECAIVVPFDNDIIVTEGPIATNKAVETKWSGDKAMGEHNYDKAAGLFREALRLLPNYEGALEGIMLIHLAKDETDKATAVLDTLLQLNPNSVDLVLRNASLLLSQYDYDKVLQVMKKAKQLDESNINNYIFTASALFAQKKYDEAIAEIKQAVKINPLTSGPRTILAGFLAEKDDFDQAYEQARLAIKYEPENVGNYLTLSGIFQNEINYRFLTAEKKSKLIKKILEATDVIKQTNPEFPNLDQLYADVYVLGDMFVLADSLFNENIKKFPDENGTYNNYAWYLATENIRLNEAEKMSVKSIELSQRNPYYFDTLGWIHFKMAMAYMQSGKKDSAEIYFGKAEAELKATIAYDMYSDFAYRHLGVVYQRWGKPDLAKSQFDIAIAMMPNKARIFTEIAQDCEEAGLYDQAIEFYLLALEQKSNLDYAAYRLAYLMARTEKDLASAMKWIDRAIELDSANFLYTGVKGIVYYKQKDLPSAMKFLEIAVRQQAGYFDKEAVVNHYYLGLVYRDLKRNADSRNQFSEYLKRAPLGAFASEVKKIMQSL